MKASRKPHPKAMLAGLLLIAAAPAVHAQSRGTRAVNSPEQPPIPVWDIPDPFHFPPPTLLPRLSQPIKPNSVSELRVPLKAAKELERSQRAYESGDVRTSAEHLEKALQIYPDFLSAHNLLGTRYICLGQYENALAEYHKAERIDPNVAQTHQNLSVALLFLNRNMEAETAARRALDLDPNLVSAHYSLARAILGQGHLTPESIDLLRKSEDTFPNASLILAQIHFREHDTDQVIAELRRYLQAPPDSDNKYKAECWIAQLTHAPADSGCPTTSVSVPNFH
jgi:tetratricopeptide (TPR) repeat protein